jgi:hypothetical protein
MKIVALLLSLFAFNAFSEVYVCNTTATGAGYRIEVQVNFNQPMAPYKVFQWSSAPPPALGERLILKGRGDLKIIQNIPRTKMGLQEDYTKWIITSPDLSLNFIHYGAAHKYGRIGTVGGGLTGSFSLNKMRVGGNLNCMKKH